MRLTVTISMSQWAGPTASGDPAILRGGTQEVDTDDVVLITALRDAHWAYRRHGTGVVVSSDDPAWATLLQEAAEQEERDLAAELRREGILVDAATTLAEAVAVEEDPQEN